MAVMKATCVIAIGCLHYKEDSVGYCAGLVSEQEDAQIFASVEQVHGLVEQTRLLLHPSIVALSPYLPESARRLSNEE